MSDATGPSPFAAVALPRDEDAGSWLAPIVAHLQSAHWQIGGLNAEAAAARRDDCRSPMVLHDLMSGERTKISQDLGPAATGCALDTGQLARAGQAIYRAIDADVALVIVNKFGAQEAAGAGLRDELLAVALAGIPLLTTVKPDLVNDWHAFAGDLGCVLPPRHEDVLAWCRLACRAVA
ncbi:MAG: DUF2478 domain-containing protein [Gammaproteobacteria bacterium]